MPDVCICCDIVSCLRSHETSYVINPTPSPQRTYQVAPQVLMPEVMQCLRLDIHLLKKVNDHAVCTYVGTSVCIHCTIHE